MHFATLLDYLFYAVDDSLVIPMFTFNLCEACRVDIEVLYID